MTNELSKERVNAALAAIVKLSGMTFDDKEHADFIYARTLSVHKDTIRAALELADKMRGAEKTLLKLIGDLVYFANFAQGQKGAERIQPTLREAEALLDILPTADPAQETDHIPDTSKMVGGAP